MGAVMNAGGGGRLSSSGGTYDPSGIGEIVNTNKVIDNSSNGLGTGQHMGDLSTKSALNFFGPPGGAPVMPNIQQGTTVGNVQGAQQGAANSLQSQQALLQALQGQGGLNAQNQALQSYQNIAQGRGPNPAQAMLNQQTGQNVANQAALMAGQRGAGANAGLLARQAAQQGAATQQQAVGQGATMQANQQLGALQGQAGLANQMAGQQIGQVNANTQAQLANQQAMQNALAGINQANVAGQGNVNAGNVGLAQSQMQMRSGLVGGLMNGGGALSNLFADGGEVTDPNVKMDQPMVNQPSSTFGQLVNGSSNLDYSSVPIPSQKMENPVTPDKSGGGGGKGAGALIALAASGGLASDGGPVAAKSPSQKAEVPGDSYSNDKIPAKLSEGEIVLPREVTMSADPAAAAHAFVTKTLAERKSIPKKNFEDGGHVKKKEDEESIEPQPKDISMSGSDAMPDATPQMVGDTIPQQPAEMPDQPAPTSAPPQASVAPLSPAAPQVQNPAAPQESQMTANPKDQIDQFSQWRNDLENGHIQPKTYKDLFADKSTLGKIGTVFGMLLSGAGSGLSHQPNMLMDMMNRQIQNDLEAQKASKEGARNYLSLMMQNQGQQADLFNKRLDVLPKLGLISKDPEGYGVGKEQINDLVNQSHEIYGKNMVAPYMMEAGRQYLKQTFAGSPQAQQLLDGPMKQAIDQEAMQAAQKSEAQKAITGQKIKQRGSGSVADEDVLNNAVMAGSRDAQFGLVSPKNHIKPSDEKGVRADIGKLNDLKKQGDIYNKAWDELDKMKGAGQLPLVDKIASTVGSGIGGLAGLLLGKSPTATAGGAGAGGAAGHVLGSMTQEAFERNRTTKKELLKKRLGWTDEEANSALPAWNDTAESKASSKNSGLGYIKSLAITNDLDKYRDEIPGLLKNLPSWLTSEEK